jgi:hypothetical protein
MASVKWEAGTDSTQLSTELNSLADLGQKIATSAYDNTSGLYLFADVEWHNASLGYTPSAGAVIELYLIRQLLDGTANYEDGDDSVAPPAANLVGVFNIRASTSAQTHILRQIPIPPDKFKWLVINRTGGTLPSSGNTVRHKPLRYQTA